MDSKFWEALIEKKVTLILEININYIQLGDLQCLYTLLLFFFNFKWCNTLDYTADLFELVLGNLQGAPETKPISEETYLRHFLLTTFSFNLFQENEKLFQMFEIADRNMFTFEFYLKHLKKVLQFFGNRALQSLRIFD